MRRAWRDGGGAADDELVLAVVARVELSENAPAVRAVDAVADGEAARVRAQRRTRTTGSPGRCSSLAVSYTHLTLPTILLV